MDIKIYELMFNLGKLIRLKRKFMDDKFIKYGLCRTQWQLLIWLMILGDNIVQKDLLINMDIDASQLTRTLDSLENMKYISRINSPVDRRSFLISFTQYAKDNILADLINYHEQSIVISEQNIKPVDVEHVNTTIQKMINNFEQYNSSKDI